MKKKNEISLFSESQLFKNWNLKKEKYHQLNYILPNEDIDDYNIIKKILTNWKILILEKFQKNIILKISL